MDIFLDTVDTKAVASCARQRLIHGVTTNPSLLSKELNPIKTIKELCALLPDGLVSVQITETDPVKAMIQAQRIAGIADNVVVKVPCLPQFYMLIDELVREDIKVNVTLVCNILQAVTMCHKDVLFISVFVGRLDDAGRDGIGLIKEISQNFTYGASTTSILAASLRTIEHVYAAVRAGADLLTMSPALLEQVLQDPITQAGQERFLHDWVGKILV